MYPAIQCILLIVCSLGCLVSLISTTRSFIVSLWRAVRWLPLHPPGSASSRHGRHLSLFFGLQPVGHVAEQERPTAQGNHEEVQV